MPSIPPKISVLQDQDRKQNEETKLTTQLVSQSITSPDGEMKNKDLEMIYMDGTNPIDAAGQDNGPKFNIKRKVIRRAQEDGFFKTGVEVVEHEEYELEGVDQDAADLLKRGDLSAGQIHELLQKKLKDDRIFGYENYDEFKGKYFKKELTAFEDFHKVRQLKYARVKYNNRIDGKEPGTMNKGMPKMTGSV